MSQAGERTDKNFSGRNVLIYIADKAQNAYDVSLVIERLVEEAEEMLQCSPEKHDIISGIYISIDRLFEWMREQLESIIAAADSKGIVNPEKGGEQVA